MATKKADLSDGAVGDQPEASQQINHDGAVLFSMDDLRARLDAPLFHRDPGLATPAQLPRLRELSLEHAVETPVAIPVPEAVLAVAPALVPPEPVVESIVDSVIETVIEPEPVVPVAVIPAPRPTLVSFSDMLSRTSTPEPIVEQLVEPLPAPIVEPMAKRQAEPIAELSVADAPQLGFAETEALLAVLADFESSATRVPEAIAPEVATHEPVTHDHLKPETFASEPFARISSEVPLTDRPSAVEAELNRLAFLPDQEEPVGRVEVPVISQSEPREEMGVPVLSQHEMYNPRVLAAPTSSKRNVFEAAFDGTVSPKRPKKGVVRRLISLIVILAILGGGLYAAKYYLLDPKWDSEVKPLVADVEAARQLQFDHAVEVTTLSGDEYSSRIARYALGINGSNEDQVAGELRALGLLTGALDLRAIGLAALPETPAFYDAGSEQIYVVEGLPLETYRFAMYRALTTALLDQEYGWGSRTAGESPSVVRGTRALYEADALATASGMLTPADRVLVLEQQPGLFTAYGVLTTPAHFATAVAGRLGVSLRAFVESVPVSDRASVLTDAVITDGQALDLRRLVSGVAEASAGLNSEGMLFWYHVLASRVDPATAWNNALPLQRDDVVVAQGPAGYCVSAVLTVPADALEGVSATFGAWAAAAPAESTTTVSGAIVDGNGQLSINACDPGLAVQTNPGLPSLTMGGAPLRSEQYRMLIVAQPALPRAQAACAVYGGSVSIADERPVVDPVEGWLVPAAHPAPDPNRAGCV